MRNVSDRFFPVEGSLEYIGMTHAYSLMTYPVAIIDNQGPWLYLNPAALEFFGVETMAEAAKIPGANWGGRLRPVAAPTVGPVPAPTPDDAEYYYDDKTSRWFSKQVAPFTEPDGGRSGRVESLHDVTTLFESDERIRTMIDAAPLCCNFWNEKFENIDCNLEAAKLFDLPDKKTYLDRFMDLSPKTQPNGKPTPEEALRHITKAFKDGFDRFEWMHQKLNGDPVPAEITLVRVKYRKGQVVLGYTRDLRSAKSVSDVDDLAWMTNVFNSLPFPTGVASAAGRWLFLNKAGLAMFDKGSVEELGRDSAVDWGGRIQPLATERPSDVPHYVDKVTDQVYRRYDSPLKDSFGGLVGRIECLQEVTDVFEAEERIRTMIDAAPLCCNFWNEKFENVDCNLEAAKLFDLPNKQAYLDRFYELSPAIQPNGNPSPDEALRHITTAFRDGFDRFQWMHQKLNGDPVPAEITLVRVNYRKGPVVLGYTRDLRSREGKC